MLPMYATHLLQISFFCPNGMHAPPPPPPYHSYAYLLFTRMGDESLGRGRRAKEVSGNRKGLGGKGMQ